MRLDPPFQQYLDDGSHVCFDKIHIVAKAWSRDDVERMLSASGLLSGGKPTKLAAERGVVDLCDRKVLWNVLEVKKALIAQERVEYGQRAAKHSAEQQRSSGDTVKWVDLTTIGTYFGVGSTVVGKWLDQLGLRAKKEIPKHSDGSVDMLDVAREKQDRDANGGFSRKVPTEKALNSGVARVKTVTNRKKQNIDITEWNLELCKVLLVKAGHELDTERKMVLKGKGRNSDVKVNSVDARAKELFVLWKQRSKDPVWKDRAHEVFNGQPKAILVRVEALMNDPGYITDRRFLRK